jgi:hypothetical protein
VEGFIILFGLYFLLLLIGFIFLHLSSFESLIIEDLFPIIHFHSPLSTRERTVISGTGVRLNKCFALNSKLLVRNKARTLKDIYLDVTLIII